MDLELKRSDVTVSIYGKDFKVTRPTVGQARKLQEKLQGSGDEKEYEYMFQFMAECGFPEDVLNTLELQHFKELTEFLSGTKKK